MAETAIVIGAGITGVAAAEWLRRDGVRLVAENQNGQQEEE